jgi:hypothetical protein
MSNRHIPLMGDNVQPITFFISKAIVHFNDGAQNVTQSDFPYHKANALLSNFDGNGQFMYGSNVDMKKDENHCRFISFKPSKRLIEAWEPQLAAGAGPIETVSFRCNQGLDNPYTVIATYMNGIGSKVIGFISADEYNALINHALVATPGEYIDLRAMEILFSKKPFHPREEFDFLIRYLIKHPMTKKVCPALNTEWLLLYPDTSLEETLDNLYIHGIVSYLAMTDYYVNETTIDVVRGCFRTHRLPEWC